MSHRESTDARGGARPAEPGPTSGKARPEVGNSPSGGGSWFWKIALGAIVGAIGYKLVDEYWPGKKTEEVNSITGIRVPAGVITGDQYDCLLSPTGDGTIMCQPKAQWPANWTAGE